MSRNTTTGYKWEDIFRKSFENTFPDGFIHKLMDTHSIEGTLKKIRMENPQYAKMVIPKVPADYIVVLDGETIFVECKTSKMGEFPKTNIKEHQFEFATDIENAGGKYIFVIRRHEPRNSEVFVVSGGELMNMFIREGRGKLSWESFRNNPKVVKAPSVPGSKYDMGDILECYRSTKKNLNTFLLI